MKGIIYVYRSGLDIYIPVLPSVVKVAFTADTVKDLDLLSEEKLHAFLSSSFAVSKIAPPGEFIVVLADDVLFVRDFPNAIPVIPPSPISGAGTAPSPTPVIPTTKAVDLVNQKNFIKEQDAYIQVFIDKVPFENINSKIITTDSSRKVLVANKDLYSAIKSGLKTLGFSVEAVVPGLVFQKVVNFTNGFTVDIAKSILTQSDLIRQNNFLTEGVDAKHTTVDTKTGKERPTNTRAIILAGVFVVLLLFMIVLYYLLYMKPQPPTKAPVRKKAAVKRVSTPAPTTQVASSSAQEFSSISLRMQSTTATASQAARIRSGVAALGISDVTSTITSSAIARTLVIFPPSLSSSARDSVYNAVREVSPSAISQLGNADQTFISIVLGR